MQTIAPKVGTIVGRPHTWKGAHDRLRRAPVETAICVTNAEAVILIVSRVRKLADEQGLGDLRVTTETDGTTTFAHEMISVHLFEAARELHVRGPGSARATQIDADANSSGQLSQTFVGSGAERILGLLDTRFSAQ